MNIEKEFDNEFCIGDYFKDIEEWRSDDYIKARKPTPKEIKAFILKALSNQKKEIRDWIKKQPQYHLLNENIDCWAMSKDDLIKFLDEMN
jgi:hypothetical protein